MRNEIFFSKNWSVKFTKSWKTKVSIDQIRFNRALNILYYTYVASIVVTATTILIVDWGKECDKPLFLWVLGLLSLIHFLFSTIEIVDCLCCRDTRGRVLTLICLEQYNWHCKSFPQKWTRYSLFVSFLTIQTTPKSLRGSSPFSIKFYIRLCVILWDCVCVIVCDSVW
jgi:hypothetical protein